MTSYILREPAYHRSAKLAAKLARIDKLGYASDIRLSSQLGADTYNQSAVSTATTETQTTSQAQPVFQPKATSTLVELPTQATNILTPDETKSRLPLDIVNINGKNVSVVRQPMLEELKEKLAHRGEVKAIPKDIGEKKSVWGQKVDLMAEKILKHRPNTSEITINQGGRDKTKGKYKKYNPLYRINGVELDDAIKLILFKQGTEYNFGTRVGTKRQLTLLTPQSNEEGYNIDILRALNDYADKYNIEHDITGVGLKKSNPPRRSVQLHWSDRVMHGDTNYVLHNQFLNHRISYYPFGLNKAPITIKTPSAHAMNIVRDMVETGSFNKEDYARLMKDEGDKMNQIIRLSNITIPHDITLKGYHAEEVADLRQRYKVLIGEITAGNRGKLLLNEMRDILRKLESYHAISAPTRAKLLRQIDAVDNA